MKTKSVQERREPFHQNEDSNGKHCPEGKNGPEENTAEPSLSN